ncbi:Uncharacterised protein [Mycobacteroides abscessus subsp. abscessus]|nr:Uncharacterised protein [Mycobacteroides abscessus subsp. abscessus]
MSVDIPLPAVLSQKDCSLVSDHSRPQLGCVRTQGVDGRTCVTALGDHVVEVAHRTFQHPALVHRECRWRRLGICTVCSGQQPTARYRVQHATGPA